MKKTMAALMIAVSATAFAANAKANNMEYKPYVGIDYNYMRNNSKDLRPKFHSGSVNIGAMYNKYFSTEIFYQYSMNRKRFEGASGVGERNSRFQAYGLDLMGYLPLHCDAFSIIGTVGYGQYRFDSSYVAASGTVRDNGDGWRMGAGAMYNLNNNLAVRGIVRYIGFDKIDGNDHSVEYSLGLRYSF